MTGPHHSPSEDEEADNVRWYFDDSANEVVDVSVTSQFTSAQRQTIVNQRDHHPIETSKTCQRPLKYHWQSLSQSNTLSL